MAMLIKADTLDDALRSTIRKLLKQGDPIRSKKGVAREFTGALVELSDPRARFSRTEGRGTLLSFIGETIWYLSGSDMLDHIEYYIPEYRKFIGSKKNDVKAPGAYGPRLFGGDDKSQMAKLVRTLKKKIGNSDTRQAVVQIFSRTDLRPQNGDVPCTTTLQFLPRKGKLHMAATMRSNDIYRGFPGDIFAFTVMQELMARSLDLEVGRYSHFVGSLHLYDNDIPSARKYLDEGVQTATSMPPMPLGDPWSSVDWLIKTESSIRLGKTEPSAFGIDPYWQDFSRLLRIKVLQREKNIRQIAKLKEDMSTSVYDSFIRGRQTSVMRKSEQQPELPGIPAVGEEVKPS